MVFGSLIILLRSTGCALDNTSAKCAPSTKSWNVWLCRQGPSSRNCIWADIRNSLECDARRQSMGLSPLSSAQQKIRDQTVKSANATTFWGFIGWSVALVIGVFFLVNFTLASAIDQIAIQFIGLCLSAGSVFTYWKLGYEKRRLKIHNSKAADVQCTACLSPLLLKWWGR